MSEARTARILDVYEVTRSIRRTAAVVGCSYSTVRVTLHAEGVQVGVRGGRRKGSWPLLEEAAGLYREALVRGGPSRRSPVLYAHQKLQDAGQQVTVGAVRARVAKARRLGILRPEEKP